MLSSVTEQIVRDSGENPGYRVKDLSLNPSSFAYHLGEVDKLF